MSEVVSDLAALKGAGFRTVYADPPWRYDRTNTTNAAQKGSVVTGKNAGRQTKRRSK